MFNLYEELTKIEIILMKEIEIYRSLFESEEKKVLAIIDTKLQDVNIYCEFQNEQMKSANNLRELREKSINLIIEKKFPHLLDTATLSDIIRKIPFNKTAKLAALRLELVTQITKLKHLNKLAPKLFEEALDVFSSMRDVLQESKKTGYNNRGKENIINKRISLLVNKSV